MPDDARWAANTWQFVATMGLAELLGGNPHHTTTEDHISPLINDATCAHIGKVGRLKPESGKRATRGMSERRLAR
jgi:hypothetical protein